ncbi:hypothetical protein BDK51DRAFT_48254 [Blyttiomyces helicus]|uniref:Uncharacterized protein n=1 Tax=Blyttiomyces helicus TaxID=388810 RepID=A0A4P9W9F9_9FUNG|nr:hypothetical protein BDK51DRAFT_48254 [Blyttiomyces helicus]|eukprot:RKO89034.1 hypothetical protein BDK51DRAFT_48254 [Blyttiomyces helicus]
MGGSSILPSFLVVRTSPLSLPSLLAPDRVDNWRVSVRLLEAKAAIASAPLRHSHAPHPRRSSDWAQQHTVASPRLKRSAVTIEGDAHRATGPSLLLQSEYCTLYGGRGQGSGVGEIVCHCTLHVWADGCCLNNGAPNARAGTGVWFRGGHEWNEARRLPGHQSN